MSTLDEGKARQIASAIGRVPLDRRLTWLVVIELSRSGDRPEGFTRQWLHANPTVKRAYLKKKAAQRKSADDDGASRRTVSDVDRLRALVVELRKEIDERDLQLDHFCDVLLRMMRNAVDNGKMIREALMADLPTLVRRGKRTGSHEMGGHHHKPFDFGR